MAVSFVYRLLPTHCPFLGRDPSGIRLRVQTARVEALRSAFLQEEVMT